MSLNIFKFACGLLFKEKGDAVYHSVINVLKTTAPVTQPLIENLLTEHNLPTTPDGALGALVQAAASSKALPQPVAEGLAAIIGQSMVLVEPKG